MLTSAAVVVSCFDAIFFRTEHFTSGRRHIYLGLMLILLSKITQGISNSLYILLGHHIKLHSLEAIGIEGLAGTTITIILLIIGCYVRCTNEVVCPMERLESFKYGMRMLFTNKVGII